MWYTVCVSCELDLCVRFHTKCISGGAFMIYVHVVYNVYWSVEVVSKISAMMGFKNPKHL